MEINKILSSNELMDCEYISNFGNYKIYQLIEDVEYLFAIDNTNLICSCFEFTETEDGMQLAHMYTLDNLKGQGIGKHILTQAVDIYQTFELPSTDPNKNYYFIEDGLGFIEHCFDINILSSPNFRRPLN